MHANRTWTGRIVTKSSKSKVLCQLPKSRRKLKTLVRFCMFGHDKLLMMLMPNRPRLMLTLTKSSQQRVPPPRRLKSRLRLRDKQRSLPHAPMPKQSASRPRQMLPLTTSSRVRCSLGALTCRGLLRMGGARCLYQRRPGWVARRRMRWRWGLRLEWGRMTRKPSEVVEIHCLEYPVRYC